VTKMIRFCAAALVLAMTAGVAAQDKPVAKQTPLKIQLVLSRYQGEKKLSSLPYAMWVTAGEPGKSEQTRLRLGVQIPVVSTVFGASSDKDKNASVPQVSYNYRDVGTNIDCTAQVIGDGTYKIYLTVTDTSVSFPDKYKVPAGTPAVVAAAPSFRNFTSNFNILLRDNQTAQYTTATDQVSGEVLKIDATLNVLK
jgi:hypothetical protein